MADSIFTVTKSVDPRLTQPAHSFCAAQGASAISVVSLTAASISTSNMVFSVIPPSPQVIIQKAPLLDLTLTFQCVVIQSDGSGTNGNSLVRMNPMGAALAVIGRDVAIGRAAPLGQIVSSYNVQINNAAVQQQNVPLPDLTHVLEGPKGRAGQSTMFRTPVTASWDDAAGTLWGLGAGGGDMLGEGDCGPGVFNYIYCDGAGTPLSGSGYYNAGAAKNTGTETKNSTRFLNGRPVTSIQTAGQTLPIYIQARIIGPVMCSPWSFNYDRSWHETGLYGISSLTIQAQLSSCGAARILQGCTTSGCILVPYAGLTGVTNPASFIGNSGDLLPVVNGGGAGSGIQNARIWMTYLSPSIQSTLPTRSIATLCNMQYFQQTQAFTADMPDNNASALVHNIPFNFSSVTFSNVPDLIMISIRPEASSQSASEADWCATYPDNAFQQFTFANQSGIFSGWTANALINMSRNNGSRASLAQYGGADGSGYIGFSGRPVVAGGSILLIRPGVDFPLPTGVAPGSTGQVQLAFQLLFNIVGAAAGRRMVCTVTALSSGFFVTDNGVSRQLLVGLDEATVLAAPEAPDRFMTQRLTGGSMGSNLGLSAHGGHGALDSLKKHLGNTAGSARGAYGGSAAGGVTSVGHKRSNPYAGASLASRLTE